MLYIKHIEANNSFQPNQALGSYLKIRFMTIAHVVALNNRNESCRRKHGVKRNKIRFSPFHALDKDEAFKLQGVYLKS